MKTLPFLLLWSAVARAAEPQIIFENRPESGIPCEAQLQEKVDPKSHGTLAKAVEDSLQTVTVRYFNDAWPDRTKVREYLTGLLADARTETYPFQIWSQAVSEPEIECLLTFKDHRQGRLLLWGTAACFRDAAGKWWFVSLFDHYHREHPKATGAWRVKFRSSNDSSAKRKPALRASRRTAN